MGPSSESFGLSWSAVGDISLRHGLLPNMRNGTTHLSNCAMHSAQQKLQHFFASLQVRVIYASLILGHNFSMAASFNFINEIA